MIDFAAHRQRLNARLAAVRASKQPQAVLERKDGCEHEWSKYKQTVQSSARTMRQIRAGMMYTGGRAYFIVKACHKCKEKAVLDYVVEK